jgi:predicted enzyme related to lactoylglutathione lyase
MTQLQTRGKLTMSNAETRGKFVWHELMTTDPDAAGDFYSKIVPWTAEPSGMPSYSLWMSGKARAGGLMALPEGNGGGGGTPAHWIIYIGTPDVDATVAAAGKLGGKVLKEAADIPNVGRFAVLSDPQGAAFAAFTPAPGSVDNGSNGGVGDFTWHELATTDLDSALSFYSDLFGWEKGPTHDMGPVGIYQIISHGGQDVGGIYKVPDASTPPNWLSYARVANAGKAATAVKAAGGKVLNGPMEVPGGSWIVMLLDPQGGAFAVVEAPAAAKAAAKKPAGAKPAAAKKQSAAAPVAKPAAKKVVKKKVAAKKAVATKAAAKGKSTGSKAPSKSGRKSAKSAPAAKKRPVAKKGTSAKRGSAVKRGKKAGKKAAARKK